VAKVQDSAMATRDVDINPTKAEGAGRPVPHWRVAIIGAGAGGLGLAIRLMTSRRRDFVLFEASDGVGGTWRSNTYPGAACDVPSHLYSYSFARKADWTKTYAEQPEILRYFEECAERFGISGHVRPNTRIRDAHWDERARRWRLTDAEGARYEADVLVSAVGTFATPSYPDIVGLDSFSGPCFHSANWEHEHDLAGRRVAVIGTGASAAQIVPEVAKWAKELYVFQRTPSAVSSRGQRETPPDYADISRPGWQKERRENFQKIIAAEKFVWDSLRRVFDLLVPYVDAPGKHEVAEPMQHIVFSTPALFASYLQKLQQMQDAVVTALRERAAAAGAPYADDDPAPRALAAAAFGCLVAAQHSWLAGGAKATFAATLDRAMATIAPAP